MVTIGAVLAILTGLCVCVAVGVWPGVSLVIIVAATLVAQTLETVTNSSAAGYLDEIAVVVALAVFSLRRLLLRGSLRCTGAYWFFGAFFALGLISSVVNSVPLGVWPLGAFLVLKGPLLALGILQLDWTRHHLKRVITVGVVFLVVILLSAAVNAVVPETWNAVVGRAPVSYRLEIPSLTGIFDHPVGLGSTMGMAFLAVLAYHRIVGRSAASVALLIATGLAGVFTFRRKSIASTLIVAIVTRYLLPGRKAVSVAILVLLLPAALLLAWAPLVGVVGATYHEYFSNIDVTARTLMTIDSGKLALAAFPLGVGFGRFGSAVASSHYSPLYEELGYTSIYGMGPGERGGFLTDTFWPSLVAETGFLGVLCYFAGLVLLVRPAWLLMRRAAHHRAQWVGAVVVAWMIQMLIESTAAPVFTGPPMFGPVFVLAGIAAAVHLHEFPAVSWPRGIGGDEQPDPMPPHPGSPPEPPRRVPEQRRYPGAP